MNGLLFVRRQLSEVQVGGIPYFHVLRMKSLQRDGAIDKLPHGSNVPSSTARQRMRERHTAVGNQFEENGIANGLQDDLNKCEKPARQPPSPCSPCGDADGLR